MLKMNIWLLEKWSLLQIDYYVPSEVRNLIDHNVQLKKVENFEYNISMLSKIIKRGVSEHKDSILPSNKKF